MKGYKKGQLATPHKNWNSQVEHLNFTFALYNLELNQHSRWLKNDGTSLGIH